MEMTEAHIIDLLPRLRARDVHELGGVLREPIVDWARKRAHEPGVRYAFLHDGQVVACGGVLEGAAPGIGAAWGIATEGWWRVLDVAMHVWGMIIDHGGYRRLECRCYADNVPANRFAIHVGFSLEGRLRSFTSRGEDLNQYGMVIGG